MNKDDLISRQAAIEEIEFGITNMKAINTKTGEVIEPFAKINDELREAVNRVKALPSAQRTGKWIPTEIMVHNYYAITGFKCSVCGEDALDDDAEPMTDYCPHCGARMVEE